MGFPWNKYMKDHNCSRAGTDSEILILFTVGNPLTWQSTSNNWVCSLWSQQPATCIQKSCLKMLLAISMGAARLQWDCNLTKLSWTANKLTYQTVARSRLRISRKQRTAEWKVAVLSVTEPCQFPAELPAKAHRCCSTFLETYQPQCSAFIFKKDCLQRHQFPNSLGA